jgi:ssRNA-specific RNase YbeY (16S rRNA maturation enzyme)
LHLIGYDDHTPDEQKTMRSKEDFYLKLREDMLKDGRV